MPQARPFYRPFFVLSALLLLCLALPQAGNSQTQQLSLSDSSWQLHTPSGHSYAAPLPGNVFIHLWQHGQIAEPFAHDHEQANKHIETKDYSYSCRFSLSPQLLQQDYITISFYGLDTYASITLNGHQLLQSQNMFRSYTIDAKRWLKRHNQLVIHFRSATAAAEPLFDAYPLPLPADNDRHHKATSVFTRKAPYQYGWDWGPRYVGQGVWQPIVLRAQQGLRVLKHRLWQQALSADNTAEVGIQMQLHSPLAQEVQLRIFSHDSLCLQQAISLQAGHNSLQQHFNMPHITRWQPNGTGTARLYNFSIQLLSSTDTLWHKTQSLGFRDIELRQPQDSIGQAFTFYVNGQAVYAKGANYIPQDIFPSQVQPQQYRRLLSQAQQAHFNMIRVWGGGIYEQDLFYRLCDSLGLMVWQDFMFACSLYPADSLFRQEVSAEAQEQIERLRDHACLALWCGNNEINELWHNWGYQKKYGYSAADSAWLWHNYQSIFQLLLPQLVHSYDSNSSYLESSPVWGWGHQESMTDGDSHYWGVWWGQQDFEVYARKLPRFASEFGFQSLPALSTILRFTDSSQLSLYSPDLQAHQKSSIGNKTIMDYMLRYFPAPQSFEAMIYISQLTQAYGLHIALSAQRHASPRCMGSLFWQLNDCWPALSWSAIDYYGQQKALYYTAKHDFSSLLIRSQMNEKGIETSVASDSGHKVKAVLHTQLLSIGGDTLYSLQQQIEVGAHSANTYQSLPYHRLPSIDSSQHYIHCQLTQGNTLLAEDYHFLALPKHLQLPATSIHITAGQQPNTFVVENNGQHLAYAVYLSSDMLGNFSNNFFHLPAGQKKLIHFTAKQTGNTLSADEIQIQTLSNE